MTEKNFQCGLEAVLEILGGKWKPLIAYHLASGAKRTGQLRRLVTNVSEKMLIQHLKEMMDVAIGACGPFGDSLRYSSKCFLASAGLSATTVMPARKCASAFAGSTSGPCRPMLSTS